MVVFGVTLGDRHDTLDAFVLGTSVLGTSRRYFCGFTNLLTSGVVVGAV